MLGTSPSAFKSSVSQTYKKYIILILKNNLVIKMVLTNFINNVSNLSNLNKCILQTKSKGNLDNFL